MSIALSYDYQVVWTNASDGERVTSERCWWRTRPLARRLVLTDAVWATWESVVRIMNHDAGSPLQRHDCRGIEAELYQARTDIPWRDFPDDVGPWEAV